MEAAAKEFSAYGFEQASLNRILEAAEVSKGAAYYYFDDKADVFSTVIQYYSQDVMTETNELPLDQLTAQTFWPALAAIYQQQFMLIFERPWALSLFKSVGKLSPDTLAANQPLAEMMEQMQSQLLSILQRGQTLGVIRQDLPDDLILGMFLAVDDTHDRWLLAHQAELTPELIEQDIVPRLISLIQRILEPAQQN
jgi:AcrR family transcriptional regulator